MRETNHLLGKVPWYRLDMDRLKRPLLVQLLNKEGHLGTARSTPQPDLLFVKYTSPSHIASQSLKRVRSHIMHQHLRRRRRRSEEAETSEEPVTEAKRPRINLLPGAERVDPFGTLSVTMTRAMSRLFGHCKRPCRLRYCLAVLPWRLLRVKHKRRS